MQVSCFVEEGAAVSYVAKTLDIPYQEAENMYVALGGYNGSPVNFSTKWPDDDPFSVCIQAFMTEKGIESLQAQYDD